MLFDNLKGRKVVLASKSPRRQQLLAGLDIPFEVRTKEVDESFDEKLKGGQIPHFLALKKAEAFLTDLADDELLITADTVVWVNDHVMNKPESREEAMAMLHELSGRSHQVFTGVSVSTKERTEVFVDETVVHFKELTAEEIGFYVDQYKPFDKAGSYGAQEFIGYIAISRLEGSYFNVMGLPVHRLYEVLKDF